MGNIYNGKEHPNGAAQIGPSGKSSTSVEQVQALEASLMHEQKKQLVLAFLLVTMLVAGTATAYAYVYYGASIQAAAAALRAIVAKEPLPAQKVSGCKWRRTGCSSPDSKC